MPRLASHVGPATLRGLPHHVLPLPEARTEENFPSLLLISNSDQATRGGRRAASRRLSSFEQLASGGSRSLA